MSVAADAPHAVEHVSCGQIARSQWCVIVDPDTDSELPTGGSAKSGCAATISATDTGVVPRKLSIRSVPLFARRLA